MTVTITIIGLGKIGTSAGLALAKHTDQLYRIGLDKHPENSRRAHKDGALDKVAYNLPKSVKDANIVLLALPADEIEETLKHIAPDLQDGAVIMDTSSIKQAVAKWAQAILPKHSHYVGLAPVVNPNFLLAGSEEASIGHADLFTDGMMGIVSPPGTSSQAIKLAVDLTQLLGAKPLFMDMLEVDGLMAAMHTVPQLVAAGVFGAVSGQPGWVESRKVGGIPFAQISAALQVADSPGGLGNTAILSSEHVLRALDNVIHYLRSIRGTIAEGDRETLVKTLTELSTRHAAWTNNRHSGEWETGPEVDIPTSGEEMRRWMVGKRRNDG